MTLKRILLVLFATFLYAINVQAQYTWASAGSGTWSTSGNWSPAAVPTASVIAQFSVNPTSGNTVTLTGASAAAAVSLVSGRSTSLSILGTASTAITFTLGGSSFTPTGASTTVTAAVVNYASNASPLILGNSTSLTLALGANKNILCGGGATSLTTGNTISINAAVTGNHLTFLGGGTWNGTSGVGPGILRFSNAIALTGVITLGSSAAPTQNGILELGVSNVLSTSNITGLTVNPFSQLYLNAASGTYNQIPITLNGSGPMPVGSAGRGALRTNAVAATWGSAGANTINIASNSVIYAGAALTLNAPITGVGQLIKEGTATVTLSGTSNSLSGGIKVAEGLLVISKNNSLVNLNDVVLAQNAGITLTGITLPNSISQTIGNLSSAFVDASGTITQNITLGTSSTLTINQSSSTTFGMGATTSLTSSIIGTSTSYVVKGGTGTLTLTNGGHTFYGGLIINAGELRVAPSAAMTITMGASATLLCPVTLNTGTLGTTGVATNSIINFGVLNLVASTTSTISLGSNVHNLNFTSLGSGTGNLIIKGWQGAYDGTTGSGGKIFIGTTTTLSSAQLAQIQFYDASNNAIAAIQLSTGEIVPKVYIGITATSYGPFVNTVANSFSVSYTTTASFYTTAFRVQLSDTAGNFSNYTSNIIGTGTTAISGSITATLSAGITPGAYKVRIINTSPYNAASSDNGSFISVNRVIPVVTSVSSYYNIIPGTTITITGSNFNSTPANNIINFGSVRVKATAGSATTLSVQVPFGAIVGQISVYDTISRYVGISSGLLSPSYNNSFFDPAIIKFSTRTDYYAGTAPNIAAIADMDGDGLNDIIAINKSTPRIRIYQNIGTGPANMVLSATLTLQSLPSNVKIADIDGDGRPDIIVAGGSGGSTIQIYRNTTNFTSSTPRTLSFALPRSDISISSISTHPGVLALGDFDRDGKIDIAAACYNTSPGKLVILRNNNTVGSTSNFTVYGFDTGPNLAPNALTSSVCVADFDGDNLPDLAVGNQNYPVSYVTVFKNRSGGPGSISFTSAQLTAGAYATDVAAVDVDNDSRADIVVTNSVSNNIGVFMNTYTSGTSLSFGTMVAVSSYPNKPAGIGFGDLDGDGKVDLAIPNFVPGGNVIIYRNTSTTGIPSFDVIDSITPQRHAAGINIGDIDNDGYPEIVTGNAADDTGTTVSVFRNYPQVKMGVIAPSSIVICQGQSTTLGYSLAIPSGMTGAWSISDPAIVTVNAASGVLTGIANGTATVTFTSTVTSGNISRYVTAPVTVNPLPVVSVTGSNSVCNGYSTTLTGLPAGGSWSNATSVTTVSTGGIVTGMSASGSDVISYSYTEPVTGCSNTDTQIVNITPLPVVGSITGPDSVCPAASVTLSTTGDAGGKWYSSNYLLASADSLTGVITGVNSGAPIISYKIFSACGVFTANKLINVRSLPNAGVISAPVTLCTGASASLSSTSGTAGSWSSATPSVASVTIEGVVTGINVGAATISYGVSNSCGTSFATQVITVNTTPATPSAITGTTNICSGLSTTLSNTSTAGTWNCSSPAVATISSSGVVTGISGGIATISYYLSNDCGVSAPTTINVSVIAPPSATIASATVPCTGYSTNIVFAGTAGDTVAYSVDGGTYLTGVLTSGGYSVTTGALTAPHSYQLHSVANIACSSIIDTTVTINPQDMVWIGGTSGAENAWGTSANWTCGTIPTVTDSVIIPACAYLPTISGTANARCMNLMTGAELNINSGDSLNVKGNLINNGIISGNGAIVLSGATSQKLSGFGSYAHLVLNNVMGATILPASKVTVTRSLNIAAGSLVTSDSLELFSDVSGSAWLGQLPVNSSILGKVQVDQYVQGGYRRFRFWAHPFREAISLSQLQNYIDITGTGGSANGFTSTASNAASAFRFDPHTSDNTASYDPGWKEFTRINTLAADSNLLHPGQGIRLFFRGAKGQGLGYATYIPLPVTVKMMGNVNQGDIPVVLGKGSITPDNQEFNMVGNPYPSPVDIGTIIFNAKQAGKINGSAFYVWLPAVGFGGQYMTVLIGTTAPIPYYIQANAAFQVRAAHDGDTLMFTEDRKGQTVDNYLFRPSPDLVTLNVFDTNGHLFDMMHLRFADNTTDANDNDWDAIKPTGADFGFYSISSDSKKLSVDSRPFSEGKTIPLGISSAYSQEFVIRAESVSVPSGSVLVLRDKLLNTETQLQAGTSYRFSIGKDKATQGNGRFELGMKKAPVVSSNALSIQIAPNPAADKVGLSVNFADIALTQVEITDLSGRRLHTQKIGDVSTASVNIDLTSFASGVYMVSVKHGDDVQTCKLVKE